MQLNMIKQMERHARQNTHIVSLGQGIPANDPHPYITEKVIEAIRSTDDINRYSDPRGIQPLREMIAQDLSRHAMQYDPGEVMVTCGAIEAINATLLALMSTKKNEVLVPVPTYSAYERAIRLARGRTVPIMLDEAESWILHKELIRESITPRTAAILLCNPNNPTGSRYDQPTLEYICNLAKEYGFFVIIDEVYGNMIYDDLELYTPASDPAFSDVVIRVVSFSKDFNLTGWRIGYLHSQARIIERILPFHDTLVNCAPVVSQYAALAALEVADEVLAANKTSYQKRLHVMESYLDEMKPWLHYQAPVGGYFFFPKLLMPVTASEFCYDLLYKANVIAIPGDDFGQSGQSHIRLCFGRSDKDIHEGMRRIKEYLYESYR